LNEKPHKENVSNELRGAVDADVVLLITCLILIGLFLLQRRGTEKVSHLFTPVILVWLFLIAAIGIYNIVVYAPSIFQACSPHYGILFLVRNKKQGWIMLGGIVLSITGPNLLSPSRQVSPSFICKRVTQVP
jgi:K+ transporter